eukprot:CAMPEP_0185764268 /NCGR_PEP_ID=MMETSP1174-20130828/23210_1 /TAXON_ID=35687 /ORGANISM="Dictyocha speculum, Strain CCMP1381" /LENGTH=32 /DNA_ID= /DNA_START= /DNA_END= /DNA_ORIENTATION=
MATKPLGGNNGPGLNSFGNDGVMYPTPARWAW